MSDNEYTVDHVYTALVQALTMAIVSDPSNASILGVARQFLKDSGYHDDKDSLDEEEVSKFLSEIQLPRALDLKVTSGEYDED